MSVFVYLITYFKMRRLYYAYRIKKEELQEHLNILKEEVERKEEVLQKLPRKAERLLSIRDVAQRMVNIIEPNQLCDEFIKELSAIFPEADDILLFLFNRNTESLLLHRSFRRKREVIREKKGDILDWWVLKHNQCLLIEDLESDYRFDFRRVIGFHERGIHSIVSSPLSIGSSISGLVRLESKATAVFSLEDSRVLRILCDLATVIYEKAVLFEKIKELAIRDSLTGLFVRSYFFERLDEEIKRSSLKKKTFGFVMLDIDDFKKINDTYGHTVGDFVLKKLASVLRANLKRAGSVVARLGGEEFAFFIVEADKQVVKTLLKQLQKDIQNATVKFRRKEVKFTVSMGVAMYPDDGIDREQLFVVADKLLYKAKGEGKNKICFSR